MPNHTSMNEGQQWSRRTFLRQATGAATGLSLMSLAGCGDNDSNSATQQPSSSAASASTLPNLSGITLTFASSGGAYQAAEETAWCKPFAAATGATIRQDGPAYEDAKIKVQIDSGNVTWDIVDQTTWWALAHEDWLEPINTSIVDTSQLAPEFRSQVTKFAVPNLVYSMIQMYDNKFAADPPKSWVDFFDLEKYPGKRGFPTYAAIAPLEVALLGTGTAPDKLYPMDIDEALSKLQPLKEHIVFYDDFAKSSQQLESKQVALSLIPSGRGYDAVKNGAQFGAQWNQSFTYTICSLALKGGKNIDAAMEFINFTLTPEAQAPIPELIAYGIVNPKAKPDLDELQTSFLPTTKEHADQAIIADPEWWSKNYVAAFEKYTAWQVG
ncbi:extracellular solute-binding protein [Streptomyces sp. NBC_00233]|uniref:extracellular solute-binding protein n=1 Tax=Streptomyces sp. NBC_00233 TaxID=2975686 RepID=UPI00225891C6|nr:extracellular solute-binding protein [Streptomyces sp. NBC_00233]MCX5233296.1 extracellular solute-binding protein [Streptomyces sp. NBC_00233]